MEAMLLVPLTVRAPYRHREEARIVRLASLWLIASVFGLPVPVVHELDRFQPTDTMPLIPRAKALMLVEALASITTIVMVAGRAVNILK